ncbi:hypothetical protein [Bacillus sp. AK031]
MLAVKECYLLTKQLVEVLQALPDEEWDAYISKVENLLERRDSVLEKIEPPFIEQEVELSREIIKWNQMIDNKMTDFRDRIKREMNGTVKKKVSVKKYKNPYDHLQTDGYYYDKKN